MTAGPAVIRTVCKYSTCSFLSRTSYLPSCGFLYHASRVSFDLPRKKSRKIEGDSARRVGFLRRRRTFTSKKPYACLEKFLCFLQQPDGAYVSGARCIGLFDRFGTTGFKFSSSHARLLIVLRVV